MSVNQILIWTGCAVFVALGGYLSWIVLSILFLAARDTYVTILNSRKEKVAWYWYLLTPFQFCQDVWRQIAARWYGYETWTLRS